MINHAAVVAPNPGSVPGERMHALDALRAYALLAGIVLHCTMSFFVGVPAMDVSQSQTLSLVFYIIHVFRMSLFYVVSGFFAELALRRKGEQPFIRDRIRRIAVPLIVGWIILLPLTGLPTLWGIQRTYGDNPPAVIQQAMTTFPLLHLWFLYYLLWFYAALLVINRLLPVMSRRLLHALGKLEFLAAHWSGPLLLALPCVATLLRYPQWNPWFGIPTPERGLTPELSALVIYGMAFLLGVLACRHRYLLERWQSAHMSLLGMAALFTALSLALIGLEPELFEPRYFENSPWLARGYAFTYCAALWYWSFGLIGMALVFCQRHNATIRYLADASYWLYLAHIPLVFFLQVSLMNVPLHWSIKFPLILIVTLAPLLYCYDRWVRPGKLGEVLNGRRMPRGLS